MCSQCVPNVGPQQQSNKSYRIVLMCSQCVPNVFLMSGRSRRVINRIVHYMLFCIILYHIISYDLTVLVILYFSQPADAGHRHEDLEESCNPGVAHAQYVSPCRPCIFFFIEQDVRVRSGWTFFVFCTLFVAPPTYRAFVFTNTKYLPPTYRVILYIIFKGNTYQQAKIRGGCHGEAWQKQCGESYIYTIYTRDQNNRYTWREVYIYNIYTIYIHTHNCTLDHIRTS